MVLGGFFGVGGARSEFSCIFRHRRYWLWSLMWVVQQPRTVLHGRDMIWSQPGPHTSGHNLYVLFWGTTHTLCSDINPDQGDPLWSPSPACGQPVPPRQGVPMSLWEDQLPLCQPLDTSASQPPFKPSGRRQCPVDTLGHHWPSSMGHAHRSACVFSGLPLRENSCARTLEQLMRVPLFKEITRLPRCIWYYQHGVSFPQLTSAALPSGSCTWPPMCPHGSFQTL